MVFLSCYLKALSVEVCLPPKNRLLCPRVMVNVPVLEEVADRCLGTGDGDKPDPHHSESVGLFPKTQTTFSVDNMILHVRRDYVFLALSDKCSGWDFTSLDFSPSDPWLRTARLVTIWPDRRQF